jgi:hypothetical protein
MEDVRVRIPADLSCSGQAYWKLAKIDACIAALVNALQRGGVDMRCSCCGHGGDLGYINLEDGRVLVIADSSFHQPFRWAISAIWRAGRLAIADFKLGWGKSR